MAREAIPTWFFVLVVVQRGDAFLVVNERKHGGGWYLPAGRVEPGETLVEAARRETLEEAGVAVVVDGVLRVEHRPTPEGARVRVFLVARPLPGEEPRTTPNEHSLGAAYKTLDELHRLPLRGEEVLQVFDAVRRGAPIAPIELLTTRGDWT